MKTLYSPDNMYYAQVIDSNQGALGGDTHVNVYENREIDAGFFKIRKKPQMVFFGDWGAYEKMQIYWKNESCLVINSRKYDIK